MLAEQVKAGKLPSVEQRLPSDPMVITPHEKVGTYGGRWRSGLLGVSDTPWISRTMGNDPLLRWAPDLTGVIPNFASKWEVANDGTEFTFYLRKGVKWSDGQPCTADDFMFWFEDVVKNDELVKVKPLWFRTGADLGTMTKVDDYTIKMTFARPNGLLIKNLGGGSGVFWQPAHYLKQFHVKYNKEKVDATVKELKLQDWVAYWGQKEPYYLNPERPVILAWRVTQGLGAGGSTVYAAERNPYYWKVDTEGNQLPYIDELHYTVAEKVDNITLKALNGEVDMSDRHIATPDNKAVFTDNKEKGGYDFFDVKYAFECPTVLALNLVHKDPETRKVFQNKDFRFAMSMAINRQEIIDTTYVGDGEPRQAAPLDESPHYHERLAKVATEYDPDKANEMLDAIGLKKGADGMRTRFDGSPLSITIEVAQAFEPWAQQMEMVARHWKAVGVNTTVKAMERSLFYQRKAAYEHDAGVWTGADGMAVVMDPRWSIAFSNESIWGIPWADWWNSGGKQGEEPIPEVKKGHELFDQLKLTADEAKQAELMKQILDIAADNLWCFGITKYYTAYGIVKNNFKNLPKEVWSWHLCNSPAQTHPEQYYLEQA
jgi:peptide/nickel transport system substrate-binding protein